MPPKLSIEERSRIIGLRMQVPPATYKQIQKETGHAAPLIARVLHEAGLTRSHGCAHACSQHPAVPA